MRIKSFASALIFACTLPLHSAPQIEQNSVVEIQILDSDGKAVAKSEDKEIIDLLLSSMKSARDAGSNTYGMSMDHYLVLIGEDSKTTRWYIDMTTGHFARESPPKLVVHKFRDADFKKIQGKLKAEPVRANLPKTDG